MRTVSYFNTAAHSQAGIIPAWIYPKNQHDYGYLAQQKRLTGGGGVIHLFTRRWAMLKCLE